MTGIFSDSAVDVNDEWTQTIQVTPYSESPQNVTVWCTLPEWTTLDGYSVAKIKREYTKPACALVVDDEDTATVTASVDVVEYVWYAYAEHRVVRAETAANTEGTTDDNYHFTSTTEIVQTLD